MKKNVIIAALVFISATMAGQEIEPLVNRDAEPLDSAITSVEPDTVNREILGDTPEINKNGDTTRIRLGKKGITIVEKDGKTVVEIDKNDSDKSDKEFYGDYKGHKSDKSFDAGNNWDHWKNKKGFKPHFAGLELNINNFVTKDRSMALPPNAQFMELNSSKSIGVRLNIFEYGFPVCRNAGFVSGLGFEFNSYSFSGNNNIALENNIVVTKPKPVDAGTYEKNKLKATYLHIPLLFEIQIPVGNSNKPLYFSAGVIGGVKIGSSTKERYVLNGQNKNEHVKGDFGLSTFRYGTQAKIGFSHLHIVATYFMSPLFLDGKGPELYPFDIGLVLLNF